MRASGDAAVLAAKREMPRVAITSPVLLAAQGGESWHCQTAFRAELRAVLRRFVSGFFISDLSVRYWFLYF